MGFSDLPIEIRNLEQDLTGDLVGAVVGTTSSSPHDARLAKSTQSALITCFEYCPNAPIEIIREGALRMASWLIGTRANAQIEQTTDPSGASQSITYANRSMVPNAIRNSGAAAILGPYRVHGVGEC